MLKLLLVETVGWLILIVFARPIAVMLIKLYQRTAPDSIRSKCVCQPTCSNYALMAIEKYGIWRALPKIYHRVVHTCNGEPTIIDYP